MSYMDVIGVSDRLLFEKCSFFRHHYYDFIAETLLAEIIYIV